MLNFLTASFFIYFVYKYYFDSLKIVLEKVQGLSMFIVDVIRFLFLSIDQDQFSS